MLKLSKTREKEPIIFTHEYHKNKVDITLNVNSYYTCAYSLNELELNFNATDDNQSGSFYYDGWRYDGRTGYAMYFHKGVILYKNNWWGAGDKDIHFLVVVYKDLTDNTYKAYINQNYLNSNPSHKTWINKFIKHYGLNPRKDIIYVNDNTFKDFQLRFEINMNDYEPAIQKELSNNFLNYKKWRIPTAI